MGFVAIAWVKQVDECLPDVDARKTYMTRVEGENTRFHHCLARLHRKTFCCSKSEDMLAQSAYCSLPQVW